MAFPVIADNQSGFTGSSDQTPTLDLPTPVSAGDLLMAFLYADSGASSVDWTGTGFTPLGSQLFSGALVSVAYKNATGGETDVTPTMGVTERSTHQTLRITGWHGTTPPAISSFVNGSGTTKNPPSLNPAAWDAEDTLWLACMAVDNLTAGNPSAVPSNYTLVGTPVTTSDVTSAGYGAIAQRNLNAASDDPGTFTHNSETGTAFTIAIRPAAADASVTGTSAVTSAAAASAASGKETFSGAAAVSGNAAAVAASAKLAFAGTVALTSLAPTVLASSVPIPIGGESALTGATPTVAIEAVLGFSGSSAVAAAASVAAEGDLKYVGTATLQAAQATVALSGTLGFGGEIAVTTAAPASASEAELAYVAAAVLSSIAPTLSASGSLVAAVAGEATISDTSSGLAVVVDEFYYQAIPSDYSPYEAIVSDEAA